MYHPPLSMPNTKYLIALTPEITKQWMTAQLHCLSLNIDATYLMRLCSKNGFQQIPLNLYLFLQVTKQIELETTLIQQILLWFAVIPHYQKCLLEFDFRRIPITHHKLLAI